jgi:hypothetical protein
MKSLSWKLCAVCFFVFLAAVVQSNAQEKDDFQKGKIVSVNKVSDSSTSTTASTGSEAQTEAKKYKYTVSVQVVDKIYDLAVDAMTPDLEQLLTPGRMVDIKIGDKTAAVKNQLGHVTNFRIVGTQPAG